MVYIWVRSTGNWHDEEAFLAQVQARFRPTLAVWHETFEMPYHRFRGRVSEIARASLAGVRGAPVAEWEEIPDGALVLPVDDDDWFAPHAAEVLEREGNRRLLLRHVQASAWVDQAPDGVVRHLEDRLSVTNRTLASQTQLRAGDRHTTPSRSELERKYRRYRRLYGRLDTSRTPWAQPYVDMMGKLMEELTLR